MIDKLYPSPSPADRVESVIQGARDRLFVGILKDDEAVDLAVRMGLVRVVYEGVAGLMGLGKLEIVE